MTGNSITVYGVRNCDTVKKARQWLDSQGMAYAFHDFKTAGVPVQELDHWLREIGWDALLNRKGTTWRKLDEALRAATVDSASARAVMLDHPSVIKRPVVDWGGPKSTRISVGFDPALWQSRQGAGH